MKRIILPSPPTSVPREVAIYSSRLLDRLPHPLFAAKYLGSTVHAQGYDLWLEDLASRTRAVRFHANDLRHCAFALGHFNGQDWAEDLPACHLPNLTTERAAHWRSSTDWRHALSRGSSLRRRLEALAAQRDLLLSAFASLDMVFCHQDASPLNLRFVNAPGMRIAILDWELCGWAPLGQELVPLVWGRWQESRADEIEARELEAWKGYRLGIERAGARLHQADHDHMRFAYLAALTLRYTSDVATIADYGLIDLVLRRGEEAVSMVTA